jgi:predicted MFS family arabinose efflux permease
LVSNLKILPLLALGFIAYYSLIQVARYNSDLYLETLTDDADTGSVRGTFMTIVNIGWLASPILSSFILGQSENFTLVYFVAVVLIVPFLIIFGKVLPNQTNNIKSTSLTEVWKQIKNLKTTKARAVRKILITDFLLNFFYVMMVIYMPIYLHQTIGFSWAEIGFIFTIMLLPFVLIEYPLGQVADKWLGEKELLALGFTIAGLATIAVSLVQEKNIWLWAGLLFATRVGAATIEIMKETALFKRIDSHDTSTLAISRNLVPVSFLLGPAFATIVLTFATHQTIFTLLGIIMLYGLYPSLTLRDTK